MEVGEVQNQMRKYPEILLFRSHKLFITRNLVFNYSVKPAKNQILQ